MRSTFPRGITLLGTGDNVTAYHMWHLASGMCWVLWNSIHAKTLQFRHRGPHYVDEKSQVWGGRWRNPGSSCSLPDVPAHTPGCRGSSEPGGSQHSRLPLLDRMWGKSAPLGLAGAGARASAQSWVPRDGPSATSHDWPSWPSALEIVMLFLVLSGQAEDPAEKADCSFEALKGALKAG